MPLLKIIKDFFRMYFRNLCTLYILTDVNRSTKTLFDRMPLKVINSDNIFNVYKKFTKLLHSE